MATIAEERFVGTEAKFLRPGDTLDACYRVEEEIGSGASGRVYRATDLSSGEVVAAKLCLHNDPGQGGRFQREGEILARLSHPAIVGHVRHGVTARGQRYVITRLLQGETLRQRLARGVLSEQETVALAARVLEGLQVAHEAGVVHRDIKPANLFLCDGRIDETKILDFGIARPLVGWEVTATGQWVGTPQYMSPEQARGETDVDGRSDIFSLGCVLFECVTGRPYLVAPGSGIGMDRGAARAIGHGGALVDVPVRLRPILAAMLAPAREMRPGAPGARGAFDELSALFAGAGADGVAGVAQILGKQEQRSQILVLVAWGAGPDPVREGAGGTTGAGMGAERLLAAVMAFVGADVRTEVQCVRGGTAVLRGGAGIAAPKDQALWAARLALGLRAHLAGEGEVRIAVEMVQVGFSADDETVAKGLATTGVGEIAVGAIVAPLLESGFELTRSPLGCRLVAELPVRDFRPSLMGRYVPCVGRERELRNLEGLFDEVVSEPVARALIVTAPAGGGKSRVRHEFTERILARGQRFEHLIARGDSLRAGAPFGLLGGALRAAANIDLGHHEAPEVRRKRLFAHCARNLMAGPVTLDTAPIEVRRLVAFLGEICDVRFPDDGDPQLLAARADPRLMADQTRLAFLDYMDAETKAGPVVLVFEDLHWGDAPSVQLVDAALRTLADRPLLVVGFARPTVEDTFPGLWQERGVEKLALPPLTSKAAHKLAQAAIEGLTEEQAARVVERADGNPFFLEELLRVVAEKGELADEGAPVTVLATVQARFDGVGEEGKRVLRAASVFGQTFRRAGVSVLLGEGASRDLGAWLDILTQREIVFPRSAGGAREFGFRHALLRDAAYDLLTPGDRKVGHHLAGEWLEKESDTEAIVLVEHFERAEELGRAAHFCRVAAEQAFGADDLPGTIARAERGVKNGAAGEELGLLRLVEGKARFWTGDYAGAEIRLHHATELTAGATRLEATAELIGAVGQQGKYQVVLTLLDSITRPVDETQLEAWMGCLLAGGPFCLWGGKAERAIQALALIASEENTNNATILAGSAFLEGLVHEAYGRLFAARSCFERACRAFDAVGNQRRRCASLLNCGAILSDLGGLDAALAHLNDAEASAVRIASSTMVPSIRANLVETLVRLGRFAEAVEIATSLLPIAETQGDLRMAGALSCHLARALVALGKVAEADRAARVAISHLTNAAAYLPLALAVAAEVCLARRDTAGALQLATQAYSVVAINKSAAVGEMTVLVVYAEALFSSQFEDAGRAAAESAWARVEKRASEITDPGLRESFLKNIPENQRAMRLRRRALESPAAQSGNPIRKSGPREVF